MKQVPQLLFLLTSAGLALGQGRILWNESVNGPLSNTYLQPTPLGTLSLGTNTVLGSSSIEPTGPNFFVLDDYFTFRVPMGFVAQSVFSQTDRPNLWAWLGNDTFSATTGFTLSLMDGNVLSQMSLAELPAGNYGMYLANQDDQPFYNVANYRLDFVLTPVPEPGTWALLGLGGLAFWSLARRRSQP